MGYLKRKILTLTNWTSGGPNLKVSGVLRKFRSSENFFKKMHFKNEKNLKKFEDVKVERNIRDQKKEITFKN